MKCFQCLGIGHYAYECPTMKIILLNWEYTSQSDDNGGEQEDSDGEVKANEGELYMIRRMLGSQVKVEYASQRENIFHTRCSVNGNVCLVIIDGGSCSNVASSLLPLPLLLLLLKKAPTASLNRDSQEKRKPNMF